MSTFQSIKFCCASTCDYFGKIHNIGYKNGKKKAITSFMILKQIALTASRTRTPRTDGHLSLLRSRTNTKPNSEAFTLRENIIRAIATVEVN